MPTVYHLYTFAFAVCDDRMNSPPRPLLPKCSVFGTGSDGEPPVEQRCQSLGQNWGGEAQMVATEVTYVVGLVLHHCRPWSMVDISCRIL